MYSTFFWFNIPLPESQMFPIEPSEYDQAKQSLDCVRSIFEKSELSKVSKNINIEMNDLLIAVTGSLHSKREAGIQIELEGIYTNIFEYFSRAHGTCSFLNWDTNAENLKYTNHYFAKGEVKVSDVSVFI